MDKLTFYWFQVEQFKKLKSIKISDRIVYKPYRSGDCRDVYGELELLTEDKLLGKCDISELSYQHFISFNVDNTPYTIKTIIYDNHKIYKIDVWDDPDENMYIVLSPKRKIYIFDRLLISVYISELTYHTLLFMIPSAEYLKFEDDFYYKLINH